MHTDLFIYSIAIQRICTDFRWKGQLYILKDAWRYELPNGEHICMKTSKSIIKFADFGFSHSNEAVRRDIHDGQLEQIGMPREFCSASDIITILNDLYYNYKFEMVYRCYEFIRKHFGYSSIEELRKDILIPGQQYRMIPHKLKGLSAEFLLNNAHKYLNHIVIESDFKKILYL